MEDNTAQRLKAFAQQLQTELVREGFVIHRYDATSTNSIYLKVDYGVGNSIRISDHNGKQHLQYRYNVSTQEKKYHADRSGKYPRFYYPIGETQLLLRHILEAREQRIRRHGQTCYNWDCLRYKQQNIQNAGFWQFARKVEG